MSTTTAYAILGATGSTGSELVKLLLDRPEVELHLYARSPKRLESMFPDISSNPRVKTFFGPVTDTALLSRCIDGCSVVFSTVATNANEPGCSVAQTVAHSIVSAVEQLRWQAGKGGDEGWESPRLVWLTSASLYPRALRGVSPVAKGLLYRALWYVYEDLRLAEEYLRAEAPWIPLTRACPGGLIPDSARGFEVGEAVGSSMIAYPDLAAGMLAMAEDDASRNASWGVASKGPDQPGLMLRTNGPRVVFGLLSSYVPGAFGVIRWLGLI